MRASGPRRRARGIRRRAGAQCGVAERRACRARTAHLRLREAVRRLCVRSHCSGNPRRTGRRWRLEVRLVARACGFGGADMHECTRARPHMLCTRSPMPAPHGISACTQPSMRAAYTSSHTRQPGRPVRAGLSFVLRRLPAVLSSAAEAGRAWAGGGECPEIDAQLALEELESLCSVRRSSRDKSIAARRGMGWGGVGLDGMGWGGMGSGGVG